MKSFWLRLIRTAWRLLVDNFQKWKSRHIAAVPAPRPAAPPQSVSMSVPMPIAVDFLGSARRHMHDAALLETNARFANSGQLLGFVAECGIKALMLWLGYPRDTQGGPRSFRNQNYNLRVHINELAGTIGMIETFVVSVSGRSGSRYISMIPNIAHFSNWSVDHRYFRESAIPNTFADWKLAAREVISLLDQATMDGMS